MIVQSLPIEQIKPYSKNPRKNDGAVEGVMRSIQEYGFQQPLVLDANNEVVVGHTRLKAAKALGFTEVPCVVANDLSDEQVKAYRIMDNKSAEVAEWDYDLLKGEVFDLMDLDFDLDLTGFSEVDLKDMGFLDQEVSEGLTDEDEVPEAPETPITVLGDVWLLGNHRLMCGDSTSIDAVEKLMNGQKADMVFTDPPYNVSFNGRSGNHEVIKNDNLTTAEFEEFIKGFCSVLTTINPTAYYIWCNWNFYGLLQEQLNFKSCIVWAKNVFGMGVGYRHQHEFCLFNGKIDAPIKNESDLWSVAKDHNYMHPTQKPVALSVRAFGNHIRLINVLDFFGGSGSTLIGAEQTGRKCFVLELDPKYCDVIIKRWQDFTGKEAVHEQSGQRYLDLQKATEND